MRRAIAPDRGRRNLFDVFATHAPIGIFVHDAGGRCIYVNAKCCSMLGVGAADLLGDGYAAGFHPADRDRVFANWRQAVAAGTTFEDEYRRCRPDGSEIWVLGRAVPVAGSDDIAFIGTLMDITERKTAELALRESRNRTQAVLDASPLAIASLDPRGIVQAWSRGAERLFGWREADVIGQPCPAIPADQLASFHELIGRVLGGDSVHGQAQSCRNHAGQPLRAALSLAPLQDGGGARIGVVAAFADLSPYERMLAQLRELVEEHERLVQDLHDTCIQSIFAVGLSLEECRRLVAVNPARAVSAIGAAAANLNLVIQDLRSFISARTPAAGSDRDFRAELERTVQAAGSGGPLFVIEVEDAAVAALQPAQIAQLLHIAREGVSNVVRHARARNGRVALRLTERCIRLEISDDGRGFLHKDGGRRGLGLHHMRARVGKLRGRWRMASTPGRGTRLFVDLPRPA